MSKNNADEKTVVKALGLMGAGGGGGPCAVDVNNGRVVRIRPLHYDWQYTREHLNPWKIQRNGAVLEPQLKSLPSPFSLAYTKRTYSPNRILYPLKRVDWNPDGDRNTQNRGKSKYKRITWDEASRIIAGEIIRVHKQYGKYSILAQVDGHGECKTVHAVHGCPTLLLDKTGGYTQQTRNPDSWEGWHWGSKHVWGNGACGMMAPMSNLLKDISEHSDLVLFWGCDPETTPWGFAGQAATNICYFWSRAKIKQVYVCPDLNYGAAIHADKWIPILPNTDAALQLAIIYVWLTEGTYDKKYVATHTVGMDKVADYVLGKEDGISKTPEWASSKCGVPEWTIKAFAREFAFKTTSIAHYFGGSYIRGPYSTEPARLECILLGMQGLGKPGVHQIQLSIEGMPRTELKMPLRLSQEAGLFTPKVGPSNDPISLPMVLSMTAQVYTKQHIPKTLIQEAILNPPVSFWSTGAFVAPVEDQFIKYTYPLPMEEGGSEIHMIWTDSPCRTTCWNDGNRTIEAMRSPKIEFIVAQHPWLENDCLMADVILPVSTTLEEDDIVGNTGVGGDFRTVGLQRQAIAPIGESKSDYEAVLEIARYMGVSEKVTEGKTVEDWMKFLFKQRFALSDYISWDEFNKKGYYVYPTARNWEDEPAGLIKFYEDPVANPLQTPTGKLEFYSERLARSFPDDTERPPLPKWIEKGQSHDERISSERAKIYPLLLMSNHGHWRVHSQCDDISWTRECPTCKVKGPDGYMYEPLWINPQTAENRGIRNGDIVKVFNERGAVLGGAYVTERLMPGVVYMDHGSGCDWIIPGKLDRGGAINLISPTNTLSKNCSGMATSGYLVETEKVTMAQMGQWQQQYPEAFNRKYDPAAGLRFDAWIEEGK
jgi:anaerobic selenocysteine-containing dehydrogenase